MTVGGILPTLPAVATEHRPEATSARAVTSNYQEFKWRHTPC